MNRLERFVYEQVKAYPGLKKRVVSIYQRVFSLIPRPDLETEHELIVREGHFFGFHDKTPWSPDDTLLLSHRFDVPLAMPRPGDSVEIGCFSGEDWTQYRSVDTTSAWNWQQGSMLQWVGASGKRIIFNDIRAGDHISTIVDLDTDERTTYPHPVGAVHPGGRVALGYSFLRLGRGMPGYGYASEMDRVPMELAPGDLSGSLVTVDLSSGEIHPLVDLSQIVTLDPVPSMDGAFHFFTHALFAPSGERFVFFHRWRDPQMRLHTRMLSTDLNASEIHIFPTDGMVSHIAWQDDHHVLAYASTAHAGSNYYLFRDQTDEACVVGGGWFAADGHPQFGPDGRTFVTDTYPNRSRIQKLLLYDTSTDQGREVARVRSPLRYRDEIRVDLHPRWNRGGTHLCFDSSHTGTRTLCTLNLSH